MRTTTLLRRGAGACPLAATTRAVLAVLLNVSLAVPAPARAQPADEQPPALPLEEIAPGVFAAIQPHERRFDDANTLIVSCHEHGALLVDPPSDRARLGALIDEIRRRGWRVGEVVSTHWHSDHTQGAAAIVSAFGAPASAGAASGGSASGGRASGGRASGGRVELLGHETLREDVPARTAGAHQERVALLDKELPAARDRLARRVRRDGSPLAAEDVAAAREAIDRAAAWLDANRDARFLPPTITYSTRMTLDRCDRRIELHHFRAHTRGDTVVRLPEEGIAATGDLLDELPYVGHGYPRSWIRTLEEIDGWELEALIPGHGPLLREERAAEKLNTVLGFLRDLVAQTDAARERGESKEQARESIDLARWRTALAGGDEAAERFFDQTIGEAIDRAWDEGAELDAAAPSP